MGEPGGGANAEPPGRQPTAQRGADRDLSSPWQGPEGWRRLQLHQLLRRPDRPEVQPQRSIPQYRRNQVKGFQFTNLRFTGGLLAVGNPDVFDLHGVVEEPAAFALCVKPVDGAAFVGEYLLEISNG